MAELPQNSSHAEIDRVVHATHQLEQKALPEGRVTVAELPQNSSHAEIDRVVHEPARYLIMAWFYVLESADFIFLQNQIGLTQGNLSSHLNKLEKAGYVDIEKQFIGKRPHTLISLSKTGRTAFDNYRNSMRCALDNLPAVE